MHVAILSEQKIRSKIDVVRGKQVMIDSDLAELYGVETKQLNRAVKRNSDRFPEEFMFQLTVDDEEALRSQNVISKSLRCQNGTSKGRGGRRYYPYVFTEHGVAMLSAVLKSDIAVEVSIHIMKAFVAMRKVVSAHAEILPRLESVEKKVDHLFKAMESGEIEPKQKVFFDGQVFDSYAFVSGLMRKAKKSIILIDNYVDDTVLTLLAKRKKNVSARILTKSISKQLLLDLEKHNAQYAKIEIVLFKKAHDRFLLIDGKTVYHIGASLKDLGKKWFAFSKIEKDALIIINNID